VVSSFNDLQRVVRTPRPRTLLPDEQSLLTSVSRLRQAGPELRAALLSGPEELRRWILSRLVKEVTYLKEDRNIEVTLVLPHPDVPLRLAAPGDLSAPGGPEERVAEKTVPGAGSCLSRTHLRIARAGVRSITGGGRLIRFGLCTGRLAMARQPL
jgi:hypothetical protein